jgi:hypothetical protein
MLLQAFSWAAAIAYSVPTVGKIIVTGIALRGAEPEDRPKILKEVAGIFRWWQRQ